MIKIFRYELQRLLWNKTFFGILIASLFYSWLVLTNTIIKGIAYTAPFSSWSYGYYLTQMLPIICLGELIFINFFTSQEEKLTAIVEATPMDQNKYIFVRCGTVLFGSILLVLSVVLMSFGFYRYFFHWNSFVQLIIPTFLTLIPPMFFCLGMGWFLGNHRPQLLYVAMGFPFLLTWLPMPYILDFSLKNFFAEYPIAIQILDPDFTIPISVFLGRIFYLMIGIYLLLKSIHKRKYTL